MATITHRRPAVTARERAFTTAQWMALAIGGSLIAGGILGFSETSSWSVGDDLERQSFWGLDVNGWHNVVHIATGALLLFFVFRHGLARVGLIVFGAAYGVVSAIGIIDGDEIFSFMPINAADNTLHIALAATALLVGLTARREVVGATSPARDTGIIEPGPRRAPFWRRWRRENGS